MSGFLLGLNCIGNFSSGQLLKLSAWVFHYLMLFSSKKNLCLLQYDNQDSLKFSNKCYQLGFLKYTAHNCSFMFMDKLFTIPNNWNFVQGGWGSTECGINTLVQLLATSAIDQNICIPLYNLIRVIFCFYYCGHWKRLMPVLIHSSILYCDDN